MANLRSYRNEGTSSKLNSHVDRCELKFIYFKVTEKKRNKFNIRNITNAFFQVVTTKKVISKKVIRKK